MCYNLIVFMKKEVKRSAMFLCDFCLSTISLNNKKEVSNEEMIEKLDFCLKQIKSLLVSEIK